MSTETTIKLGKLQWTDISSPNEDTVKMLEKKYDFHELDLEDCLSKHQRPKIDEYEDYLFIVLHFPFYSKRLKRVVSEELDIFIGPDYLITLHDGQLRSMNKLIKHCKQDRSTMKEYMGKGTGYLLYMVIRELFDEAFPILDDMWRSLAGIERDLFDGDTEKDMVRDILWLKKDVINFRRIVSPQRAVIAQLEHKNKKFLPENLEVYFDDVVDKIEKMWGTLENLKELTESLQDTNEVLISHQTNRIIKILTVFSVVLLPLTVITGFYGMNVQLPYAETVMAAKGITLSMLGLVVLMLVFFKWKRWL
ncbi:MAG: magnesium transporter CorA family protein [Candidatus Peregrinibacteria bacterium]|nr:magnesium transporter CorA family protein [Candidatus Peregrinibacteria bacterium]